MPISILKIKNKLHFNVKPCTWLNFPQSLKEASHIFKELTGQMEMTELTTKEQLMNYFIISEVTPNIYVSKTFITYLGWK